MFKKVIEYEDFNGVKQSEEFWFGVNKTDLLKWNNSYGGTIQDVFEDMMNRRDVKALSTFFDELIFMSYGEKSVDGKSFVKVDENGHKLSQKFSQTAAYDALYLELMNDFDKAAMFLIGILPKDMADGAMEEYQKMKKQQDEENEKKISLVTNNA